MSAPPRPGRDGPPSRSARLGRGVALGGAAASMVVAAAIGVHLVREAGFRFRWERAARMGEGRAAAVSAPRSALSAGGLRERASAERRAASPPGAVSSPVAASLPGAAGEPARASASPERAGPAVGPIGFETLPDGRAACVPCPVSREFEPLGVRFAFVSWTAAASRPHLVDAGAFAPPAAAGDPAVAAAYQPDRGLEVGVIRMEFPGRPTRVAFELTGPDLIARFEVTAWAGDRRMGSRDIARTGARRYVATGGGWFRRETVTVESASGIEAIELDGWGPPGHVLLVDDLVIGRDDGASGA